MYRYVRMLCSVDTVLVLETSVSCQVRNRCCPLRQTNSNQIFAVVEGWALANQHPILGFFHVLDFLRTEEKKSREVEFSLGIAPWSNQQVRLIILGRHSINDACRRMLEAWKSYVLVCTAKKRQTVQALSWRSGKLQARARCRATTHNISVPCLCVVYPRLERRVLFNAEVCGGERGQIGRSSATFDQT